MKLLGVRKRWWVVAALLILIAAGGIAFYVRVNSVDYKAAGLLAELRNEPPGFFEGWLIKLHLKSEPEPRDPFEIAQELADLGSNAVPYLVVALETHDFEVRLSAVKALESLGEMGPAAAPAVPALIESLKDESERFGAVYVLRWIGPAAAAELGVALRSESREIRDGATEILADMGPKAKRAVPALIAALEDKREDVRRVAIFMLGEIGPDAKQAVPALVVALEEDEGTVDNQAGDALIKIGGAAVPDLIDILRGMNRGERVLEYVKSVDVLAKIGRVAVPGLIDALKNDDPGRCGGQSVGDGGKSPGIPLTPEPGRMASRIIEPGCRAMRSEITLASLMIGFSLTVRSRMFFDAWLRLR